MTMALMRIDGGMVNNAFAVMIVTGGVLAYQRNRSQTSLVVGLLIALLFFWSSVLKAQGEIAQQRHYGFELASLASACVAFVSGYRFTHTQDFVPHGVLALLGLLALLFNWFLVRGLYAGGEE